MSSSDAPLAAALLCTVLAAASLCAVLAPARAMPPAGLESGPFEFRPGVIVDPARAAAYLMTPRPGIEAVELASGKLLWRTQLASKPLLLEGDLLVARAEPGTDPAVLRLVILSVCRGGEKVFDSEVKLPAGVEPLIDDRADASFRMTVQGAGASRLLAWSFRKAPARGVPPPPGVKPFEATGALRIDLEDRRIEPVEDGSSGEPGKREAVEGLPRSLRDLVASGKLKEPPWRVGGAVVAIDSTLEKGRHRVSLKRWHPETGEPFPEVKLFGPELALRYPSADRRHLLASKPLVEPGGAAGIRYLWTIFSLETAERVAEVPQAAPGAWFFIAGTSLIFEARGTAPPVEGGADEPPRLVALDLKTGKPLWERAFRDTAHRGSLVPHAPAPATR